MAIEKNESGKYKRIFDFIEQFLTKRKLPSDENWAKILEEREAAAAAQISLKELNIAKTLLQKQLEHITLYMVGFQVSFLYGAEKSSEAIKYIFETETVKRISAALNPIIQKFISSIEEYYKDKKELQYQTINKLILYFTEAEQDSRVPRLNKSMEKIDLLKRDLQIYQISREKIIRDEKIPEFIKKGLLEISRETQSIAQREISNIEFNLDESILHNKIIKFVIAENKENLLSESAAADVRAAIKAAAEGFERAFPKLMDDATPLARIVRSSRMIQSTFLKDIKALSKKVTEGDYRTFWSRLKSEYKILLPRDARLFLKEIVLENEKAIAIIGDDIVAIGVKIEQAELAATKINKGKTSSLATSGSKAEAENELRVLEREVGEFTFTEEGKAVLSDNSPLKGSKKGLEAEKQELTDINKKLKEKSDEIGKKGVPPEGEAPAPKAGITKTVKEKYLALRAQYPKRVKVLGLLLANMAGSMICRYISTPLLIWNLIKKFFANKILNFIEEVGSEMSSLIGLGGISIITGTAAYQSGGLPLLAEVIALKASTLFGCLGGAKTEFVVLGTNIVQSTGVTENFDTITLRAAAAMDLKPEEVEDALYGEMKDPGWWGNIVDAAPIPLLYADYGKLTNTALKETDLIRLWATTTYFSWTANQKGLDSVEIKEFVKNEIKQKFFITSITASQITILKKYLENKGIHDSEIQASFLKCLFSDIFLNSLNRLAQDPLQNDKFQKQLNKVVNFAHASIDVVGLSKAGEADKEAIARKLQEELNGFTEKFIRFINDKTPNIPNMPTGEQNANVNKFYDAVDYYLGELQKPNFNAEARRKELTDAHNKLRENILRKITYYQNADGKGYPKANKPEEADDRERYRANNINFYKGMLEKQDDLYTQIITGKINKIENFNTLKGNIVSTYDCSKIKNDFSKVWNEAFRLVDVSQGNNIEEGDIVTLIETGGKYKVLAVQKEEGTITVQEKDKQGNLVRKEVNKNYFTIFQKARK